MDSKDKLIQTVTEQSNSKDELINVLKNNNRLLEIQISLLTGKEVKDSHLKIV